MKTTFRYMCYAITVFVMSNILIMPKEIMAQEHGNCNVSGLVTNCPGPGAPAPSTSCTPVSSPSGQLTAWCSPEMSDYMAAAFIVVAGGMAFRLRRRALAKA